jgi:hypothetical protein
METKSHSLEFRQSVGESFNIYQATVAMIAIFIGFVFSSLLSILTSPDKIDWLKHLAIWSLIAAMLFLLTALLSFHATAHRVIRYWGIFYPSTIYQRIGGLAMHAGLVSMFASISVLLWSRDITIGAIIVGIYSIGLVIYAESFRRMHGKQAPYITPLDHHCGIIQKATAPETNITSDRPSNAALEPKANPVTSSTHK